MPYQHKYDKRGSAKIGNEAERKFIGIASKRGFHCDLSSEYENKVLGIDIWITKKDKRKGVDVKAQKKESAKDKNPSEEWTWIEYKNEYGYDGWLLKQADYIAFEKKDYFLVVDRISLYELCEKLIDKNKEYAKRAANAKYILYNRRDEELMSQIKTSDILKIKRKSIWEKSK